MIFATACDPIGIFYGWWRGDPVPKLSASPGLHIAPIDEPATIVAIVAADVDAVAERVRRGHRLWLASVDGEPVGLGWCATAEVEISELGLSFPLPPDNRYLWDFVTIAPWRGKGVYPALLQAMMRAEAAATRFWIGHDLGNDASGRGILKAGFRPVGMVDRRPEGLLYLPTGPIERARAAAELLGIPMADT